MKLSQTAENYLAPFRGAVIARHNEETFNRAVNVVASVMGELKIETDDGDLKVSSKGILSQSSKSKAALSLNNGAHYLFMCAVDIANVSKLRKVTVNASLPELPVVDMWLDGLAKAIAAKASKVTV
jgi:hypothetical protein